MKYRKFGVTGLEVSELGFGCGRVGGLLLGSDEAAKRRAIASALEAGVNWFDTAAAYGTEAALGALLAEARADVFVSTKVTLDPRAPDLAAQVEAEGRAGLARLGRRQVTVLQIHNRVDDSGGSGSLTSAQMIGPVREGLERMRRAGATRFVGFTALGDAASILKTLDGGAFDSVQVYYNPVNPSAARTMPPNWSGQRLTGVLESARARGMGVLAIRILDGGILAADDRVKPVSMMARETTEPIEAARCSKIIAAFGSEFGTRPQIGVRFALSCPDVSVALVGIGAPEHIGEAAEGVRLGPLPQAALDRLESLYRTDFA